MGYDPDFLCDRHRTIVPPPTTGRTAMTVHERNIAAAIDPVTLGRLAEVAVQAPSDSRISRFVARRSQNPTDFARKRQQ